MKHLNCPNCGQAIDVTGHKQWDVIRCPSCQARHRITKPISPIVSEPPLPPAVPVTTASSKQRSSTLQPNYRTTLQWIFKFMEIGVIGLAWLVVIGVLSQDISEVMSFNDDNALAATANASKSLNRAVVLVGSAICMLLTWIGGNIQRVADRGH